MKKLQVLFIAFALALIFICMNSCTDETQEQLDKSLKIDLVAFYPFNGNANDSSGNNIHGVVYGAYLTADRFGEENSAYNFDGIDDWIDLGDNDNLNPHLSDVTISAWIKTSSPDLGHRIFSKGTNGGYQSGYALLIYPFTPGQSALIFGIDNHEHIIWSDNKVNNGSWHMITGVVRRNSHIEQWIDGVRQIEMKLIKDHSSIDLGADTYNATIGVSYCYWDTPNELNEFFSGKIDDVRVWMRALSEEEILALYKE